MAPIISISGKRALTRLAVNKIKGGKRKEEKRESQTFPAFADLIAAFPDAGFSSRGTCLKFQISLSDNGG